MIVGYQGRGYVSRETTLPPSHSHILERMCRGPGVADLWQRWCHTCSDALQTVNHYWN